MLQLASRDHLAVVARGGGTKQSWGAPPQRVDMLLSTSRLNAVVASDLLLTRGDADLAHSLGLSLLVWFPFSESQGVAVSHADGVVSDHPDVRCDAGR